MQDQLASLLEDFNELKWGGNFEPDSEPAMSDIAAAILVLADQFWMISDRIDPGTET